jgi:uncharacterized protein YbjT (DUF2867 family)
MRKALAPRVYTLLDMILVTGATGTNDVEVVKLLAARRIPVRAMARSPERARKTLAGAELVTGDFDDSRSIDRALEGVDRTFLLTASSERAENTLDDAHRGHQLAGRPMRSRAQRLSRRLRSR